MKESHENVSENLGRNKEKLVQNFEIVLRRFFEIFRAILERIYEKL